MVSVLDSISGSKQYQDYWSAIRHLPDNQKKDLMPAWLEAEGETQREELDALVCKVRTLEVKKYLSDVEKKDSRLLMRLSPYTR